MRIFGPFTPVLGGNCDKGQGFLYARPLTIDEVPAFLATKMARTALLPAP
jgi:hypothetical protein